MTWIFGFHPVREALRAQAQAVARVAIEEGRSGRRRRQIEELCSDLEIPLQHVATDWFEGRTNAVHNGFAAETRQGEARPRTEGRDSDLVVLAEDIQDPRNLGALVRVAEAAGVGRLLLRDRGSTAAEDVVARTSAGAVEHLPVERITNTAREIARLQEEGFWVYGADRPGVPPWELDLTGKVALVVGGEERGLRRLTRERCDALVGLPMLGRVESLNLATAAAAILYDVVRQRAATRN